MHKGQVRPYEIATYCRTQAVTRHVPNGPRREIVRSFHIAPEFWPVTVDQGDAALTGYGIDRGGACIRYTRNPYPLVDRFDEATIQRVQFAPRCHELMCRATRVDPAFVCATLPYRQTIQIFSEYLVDAAVSLCEGRGPIRVPAMARPHIPR